MDRIAMKTRIAETARKYRYAIIIVLVGVLLMLLPTGSKKEKSEPLQTNQAASAEAPDPAKELETILGQIKGAGQVKVMLTVARGEEVLYQWDEDSTTQENSGSSRKDTVIVSDSDRQQTGLIRQVNPPVYQGAVVVCQGADNDAVRLSIVKAVNSVTGLGADRICVLRMK